MPPNAATDEPKIPKPDPLMTATMRRFLSDWVNAVATAAVDDDAAF